jgi:hypothetical protein
MSYINPELSSQVEMEDKWFCKTENEALTGPGSSSNSLDEKEVHAGLDQYGLARSLHDCNVDED